jgi:hypothetical protein
MFAEEQEKQAESKKRAEAQKGKQAATEDPQSQSDDFVRNKKIVVDETRRKKVEVDNKRNLSATKKLEFHRRKAGATKAEKAATQEGELKKKAAADKKAEKKEKKIIAEIQKKMDANMAAL